MTSVPLVESAARKALSSAARFLPQLSRRAEARLLTDHRPISGAPNFHDGSSFWLWVVAAPSHSPQRLEPQEFTERAHDLATLALHGFDIQPDYLGSEEARFTVPSTAHPTSLADADHILRIYPDGRVVLRWGLQTSPIPGTHDVELSLDEIVAVLYRMYAVAHDPTFAAIHQRRRTEALRRIDWRVGLTPSISVIDHGSIYWRKLFSSTPLPAVAPMRQNPSCPVHGFANDKMLSVKKKTTPSETFTPALAQLLVDAGYTGGVAASVQLALATRQPIPALPLIADSTDDPAATS